MNRCVDVDTISCCGVPVVAGDELSISGGYNHRGINRRGLSAILVCLFFPDVLYCDISFSGRLDDGMDRRQ